MSVTQVSHRDSRRSHKGCHKGCHTTPTRPDPTRPISVVTEVFGSLNKDRIRSNGDLGAGIGFGVDQ